MSLFIRLRALLNLLLHRDAVEKDLDDEIHSFYQTMVDRYIEQGVPECEARRLANLKFGNPEEIKEEVRDIRAGSTLAAILRDANYALRGMRKNPAFAFVTIVTLALGIGANSTIFSIVSRFLLRPPPVGDPATLMALHTTHDGDRCCNNFTWPLFSDLREQSKSFSGLTAYYDLFPASIAAAGDPVRVWGQAATANFFDVAQIPMTLGRGFAPDEENLPVIVLGQRLWRNRFAADPAITGKTITLSGQSFTVIGVAPPSFRGLDFILDCQFWIPLGSIDRLMPKTANYRSRTYHWLAVAGRMQPGTSRGQVAAELALLAHRFAQAHPDSEKGGGFRFDPAGSLPPRDKNTILIFIAGISAVAMLVLCIACANVANLSLAQAAGRRKEMAVRLALGATHGQLLRQLLTESLLLSLSGGLLGIAISVVATRALASLRVPAPVPLDIAVAVDWRVLVYTFALSVGAGILFGLAPAWATARPLIASALQGEDLLSPPGRVWSLRNFLVVSQIAMSLVLLCATGLFLRSLRNAVNIDIGFRAHDILMMSIDPRLHGYAPERTLQFLASAQQQVAALPGVISVAWTDAVPLSGGHRSDGFQIEGRPNESTSNHSVELYMASPGYFETMGIPRIAGRDFANDTAASPRVAIVNQVFARTFFPGENPLGQRVRDGDRIYQIVGIVGNIKSRTLGEELRPVLYRAIAQDLAADPSFDGYSLVVHYAANPAALQYALRREIHALDPTLAIFNSLTMDDHLRDALLLPRLTGTLFGIFGFIGLSLAAVGLYGVMSYWVSRRTREIGIRLAVGARIDEVQRLIIRQGMQLTAIGIVPGLAAAWALAKLFTSFLYGVPEHDAAIFTLVPLFLTVVALFACWISSRRAAKVDPSATLRHS